MTYLGPLLAILLGGCGDQSGETTTTTSYQTTTTSVTTTPTTTDLDWDGTCNPLNVGDDCMTPFPSSWHFIEDDESATGLRQALHNGMFVSPDGDLPLDISMFNLADGTSPVSPLLVHFGVDIDEAYLSGWGEQEETTFPDAPIALIDLDTGESLPILTEMDQANRSVAAYDQRHALIIRPLAPMSFSGRYAVILSRSLTDTEGAALPESEVFNALRDTVITTNSAVEELRNDFDMLFESLDSFGWARDEMLLAWEIPVASEEYSLGPILSAREQALAEIKKNGVPYTIDSVEADPYDHMSYRIEGTFTPPNFLSSNNRLILNNQGGIDLIDGDQPTYPFIMTVPSGAKDHGDLALVLIGHGLFGSGESMLSGSAGRELGALADPLDGVLIATDWIGLSGGDYDLIVSEILTDLSNIRTVTDRLVQSHINQLALVELAIGGLLDDPVFELDHADVEMINPDDVHYYGISLGGIQGTSTVSISPRIKNGVVAVPGAGWANLIQRSTQFEPLEVVIDIFYPDPLTQIMFIGASQSFWDWSDPATVGTLLAEDPSKTLILQEAIGDCQVANITTDLLSRRLGAAHLETATDPVFGLDTVKSPATGVVLTQIRVPEDLKVYFPPDENTTPELDNGVHNSAVLQEATLNQAMTLFSTGEAVHPCDGVCDPD